MRRTVRKLLLLVLLKHETLRLLLRVDENLSVEFYELKDEKDAITHFERKYVNVGVKLYQFSCHLGSRKLLNA